MRITSTQFVKSAVQPADYPPAELPEIAFAGRSNVGKSSLINTLVVRKRLVRTSGTPGRTRLLNFFTVNDRIGLVDLPGYGYAKVPAAEQRKWGPMVETYLATRTTLRGVVLIMDIRRDPGEGEREVMAFLDAHRQRLIPVLTKADKLSRSRQAGRRSAVAEVLGWSPADFFVFSARTRQGRDDLWAAVVAATGAAA
jgi:GTP-binding protein